MARGWKIAAVAAAFIVIGSSTLWYFVSPAWTLEGMKNAAQSHDSNALNAYIDYPALRKSLKAQLIARVMTGNQKAKPGFGSLELGLGSAIIGPMIDGIVSPTAIRAALLADRQEDTALASSAIRLPTEPIIVRRKFSEFVVTARTRPTSRLVFKRHGLSWMLSGVELPPDP